VAHLTQGLKGLATLPGTPERAQQELVMQTTLGPALIAIKGQASPEVLQAYARARELCQQVGETPQLFQVLRGLWLFYLLRLELQTARELGQHLLTLAQRAGDSAFLLEAHYAVGTTLNYLGEFAAAQAHYVQGIALYDPQQHRSHAVRYGMDVGVMSRIYGGVTLWWLGYPDQALQQSHEALTLAREEAGLTLLAEALAVTNDTGEHRWEAELHRLKGELLLTVSAEHATEAATCFRQALDVARRQQAKSWELRAAMSLTRLWQGQGKHAEARELLAPIYDWFTEGFDTADLREAKGLLEALP
jgi:predicted ATPase